MGLIYKIANDINNKVYIGQTRNFLNKRIKEHLKDSRRKKFNYPIYNAIRKYGWKHFTVEVLEDNIPLKNLNEREIYWTNKFNALSPNGYVCISGQSGRIFSEETKKKMSKSALNNKNASGYKHTKETKRNLSKYAKKRIGLKHPKSKSVLCYDLNDNFIKKYNCIMDAVRELNLKSTAHITEVCKNKLKQTGGFIWRYSND